MRSLELPSGLNLTTLAASLPLLELPNLGSPVTGSINIGYPSSDTSHVVVAGPPVGVCAVVEDTLGLRVEERSVVNDGDCGWADADAVKKTVNGREELNVSSARRLQYKCPAHTGDPRLSLGHLSGCHQRKMMRVGLSICLPWLATANFRPSLLHEVENPESVAAIPSLSFATGQEYRGIAHRCTPQSS
jgi:hypothetical protein